MKRASPRMMPLILVAGDISVVLLLVFIGQRDHGIDDPQPLLHLVLTGAYFALPWAIVALLSGAYHTEPVSLRREAVLVLNGWLIAAPFGALLRSFANGTGVILSPFLVVMLLIGTAFLMAWRLAYILLTKRRE